MNLLDDIQSSLFNQAKIFMDSHTTCVSTWEEFQLKKMLKLYFEHGDLSNQKVADW